MDERARFVARLLDGETMTALCGVRHLSEDRLQDRPAVSADRDTWAQRPESPAVSTRQSAPDRRRDPHCPAQEGPARVGRAEDSGAAATTLARPPVSRHQHRARRARSPRLVTRRRRGRRPRLTGTPLAATRQPNGLWCADYKGEFLLRNQRYCYPLTITDYASRYLLACEALSTTQERYAFSVFERAFQDYGLPEAMRTDNGVPFASAHALYGLSKLAVWWLRLGIRLERIAPGHPEQNGRHERMHLTLKTEATRPAAHNVLQQQMHFDTFVHRFNHERPHQALDMATPASRYAPSPRPYRGLEELDYPFHDWTAVVTRCGRICYQRRKVNLSQVFAGQKIGVKQTADHVWLVSFMESDLGYFDDETCRLEPIEDPFGPRLLPMSPE